MAGLYVHIPFCKQRCIYCDFYSTTRIHEVARYVQAVAAEAALRVIELKGEPLTTVYIGGGTPSMLGAEQLVRLAQALRAQFDWTQVEEFTVEVNPDDVRDATLPAALAAMGVNRVSMGAQSFVDSELLLLRRRHDSRQPTRAIALLREAGIDNVSLDLIYGIPGQTLDTWRASVDAALACHPQHISAYNLTYEPGTPLWRMREAGQIVEVGDDDCVDMYTLLVQALTAAGYEHYEISNFAKPSFRSRHNSAYWTGAPYLGLGAGAHSYDGTTRRYNPDDLTAYIQAMEAGRVACLAESLEWWERYDEMIMVRLRTCEGLDLDVVEQKFGSCARAHAQEVAKPYLSTGLLKAHGTTLHLTEPGVMTSDTIIRDLMWDADGIVQTQ